VEAFDSTVGIVALAAAGAAVISLLLCLTMALLLRRLRSEQRLVLGERKQDLVEHAAGLTRRVEDVEDLVDRHGEQLSGRIAQAERRLDGAVTHTAVLRYDAFNETSGRQSSTVALLDDGGNGVLITAILQRDQARVYAKPVAGGQSELELSPEEVEAMRTAKRRQAEA
jgi:hypothetical protein